MHKENGYDAVVKLSIAPRAHIWAASIDFPTEQQRVELMSRLPGVADVNPTPKVKLTRHATHRVFRYLKQVHTEQKMRVHLITSCEPLLYAVSEWNDLYLPRGSKGLFDVTVQVISNLDTFVDLDRAKHFVGYNTQRVYLEDTSFAIHKERIPSASEAA